MGVINMAHGELMMLGAYTTYAVQLSMPNHIGALFLWRSVGLPVSGCGHLDRTRVVRFLYGRHWKPAGTWRSLIWQQIVRDVFTPTTGRGNTAMAGGLVQVQ